MTWSMQQIQYPMTGDQHYYRIRRHPCERERMLWAAVLAEAYENLHGKASGENYYKAKIKMRNDAVRWFTSQRIDVGSYRWVCREALGIDPEDILKHLRAQGVLAEVPVPKRRHHRKRFECITPGPA